VEVERERDELVQQARAEAAHALVLAEEGRARAEEARVRAEERERAVVSAGAALAEEKEALAEAVVELNARLRLKRGGEDGEARARVEEEATARREAERVADELRVRLTESSTARGEMETHVATVAAEAEGVQRRLAEEEGGRARRREEGRAVRRAEAQCEGMRLEVEQVGRQAQRERGARLQKEAEVLAKEKEVTRVGRAAEGLRRRVGVLEQQLAMVQELAARQKKTHATMVVQGEEEARVREDGLDRLLRRRWEGEVEEERAGVREERRRREAEVRRLKRIEKKMEQKMEKGGEGEGEGEGKEEHCNGMEGSSSSSSSSGAAHGWEREKLVASHCVEEARVEAALAQQQLGVQQQV
jgi:hypothetical protein